jgi:hypothetical protein
MLDGDGLARGNAQEAVMAQAVSVLLVGGILAGAFVGMKVGTARWSHRYYRRNKAAMPGLRRTAWSDIRTAAGLVLLVAVLIAAFLFGISAQG